MLVIEKTIICIIFTILMSIISYFLAKTDGINQNFLLVILNLIYGIYVYILL